MEIPVSNKLVPFLGLMLLAGPVLTVAAPSAPGATATHATKKTHKHSHHKRSSKPAEAKT